jgi:hypothetical protein
MSTRQPWSPANSVSQLTVVWQNKRQSIFTGCQFHATETITLMCVCVCVVGKKKKNTVSLSVFSFQFYLPPMTDYVPGQLSSLFLGGVQTSSPEKKKKRNKATKTGGVNSTLEQLFATSVGQ